MADDWKITQGPVEVPSDRDSHLFRVRYTRGEVEREVFVHISGTSMAAGTDSAHGGRGQAPPRTYLWPASIAAS
jgi:hypothetical protein